MAGSQCNFTAKIVTRITATIKSGKDINANDTDVIHRSSHPPGLIDANSPSVMARGTATSAVHDARMNVLLARLETSIPISAPLAKDDPKSPARKFVSQFQ